MTAVLCAVCTLPESEHDGTENHGWLPQVQRSIAGSRDGALVPGLPVWWMRTLGGGGGSSHRPNEREPVPAYFLKEGNGSKVQIRTADQCHREKPFWVRRDTIVFRNAVVIARLEQGNLRVGVEKHWIGVGHTHDEALAALYDRWNAHAVWFARHFPDSGLPHRHTKDLPFLLHEYWSVHYVTIEVGSGCWLEEENNTVFVQHGEST